MRGVLNGASDADARGLLGRCVGCDARGANIAGRDLSGVSIIGGDLRQAKARGVRFENADLEGVSFRDADLREADLRNARLCSHDDKWRGDDASGGRAGCADFQGADVHGADLRGVLICGGGHEPRSCTPVDAGTLRRLTKSNLDGATLP